jgi:hypothetical protein
MADSVEPEVLVNAVLGKVTDVLINGDGNVIPKSDDHFVAFMNPGYPAKDDDFDYALEGFGGVYRRNTDPDDLQKSTGPQDKPAEDPNEPSVEQQLAADALRKYQRAENFFNVFDLVPDTSGILDSGRINTWNPETRISQVYAMALQQSQVYDNQPDEATTKKVESWRSKLVTTRKEKDIVTDEEVEVTEESEIVKRYNAKMLDYLGAAMEYNNVRISAMAGKDQEAVHQMAVNGPLLQMKVRAALNAWASIGYRDAVDRLSAAIQSVEDRAFVLLKQRYKEDYFRSLLTNPSSGSNFLYYAPATPSFARTGSGWTRFYFNSSSYASNHQWSSSTTAAVGGFHVGVFGVAGGGQVEKRRFEGKLDTKNFSMSFEMCRVPIARPAINLSFLLSGFWRFDQNNQIVKNVMVSDGKRPAGGLMPAITTDAIFIRNLHLHFGDSHSQFLSQQTAIEGGGGVSYGPFHLGGRHAETNGEQSLEANWSEQGIDVNGTQLLGMICWMLPQSPNPNPSITEWI